VCESNARHLVKDIAFDNLDELVDFNPEVVFHLAAAFERSEESPGFWDVNWHDNTLLSHRILDFTTKMHELDAFVFASSYLVYSTSLYMSTKAKEQAVLLKEDALKEPRNLCGAAKYYAEHEIAFMKYLSKNSIRIVDARIFRVYGYGSKDVISRWVRAALSGETVKVNNQQNRFDFIFAGDVAEGLLRTAISSEAEGAINLGSGISRSIDDILRHLTVSLPETPIQWIDKGVTKPFEASCADLTKLKEKTGWIPDTSLEKGIEMLIKFEQSEIGKKHAS
jgi:nucleoside-diphosphate-sugar epimerase